MADKDEFSSFFWSIEDQSNNNKRREDDISMTVVVMKTALSYLHTVDGDSSESRLLTMLPVSLNDSFLEILM